VGVTTAIDVENTVRTSACASHDELKYATEYLLTRTGGKLMTKLRMNGQETADSKVLGFLWFVGIGSLLISLSMILDKVIEGTITEVSSGYAFVVVLMLIMAIVFIAGGIRELLLFHRNRDDQ
jgi:hypothetical protein